jgi:hypothetical protein
MAHPHQPLQQVGPIGEERIDTPLEKPSCVGWIVDGPHLDAETARVRGGNEAG